MQKLTGSHPPLQGKDYQIIMKIQTTFLRHREVRKQGQEAKLLHRRSAIGAGSSTFRVLVGLLPCGARPISLRPDRLTASELQWYRIRIGQASAAADELDR